MGSRRPNVNPRPPCGGRRRWMCAPSHHPHFNPRPPCGGRLIKAYAAKTGLLFQSTPPVWGATDILRRPFSGVHISIHAPRVGGDRDQRPSRLEIRRFQSTPPVWGATPETEPLPENSKHFNPRPPCGGRPPHSAPPWRPSDFNPRPPCGWRQGCPAKGKEEEMISIHAPRVGGDKKVSVS